MDSLELTRELYKKGYLSKQASMEVLRERDKLVKTALRHEAIAFFKEAGIGSFLKKFKSGGKTPAPEKPRTGWSDVGANLTKILALAGLTSASAAGIDAFKDHRRDKKLRAEVERSYGQMSSEYPRLREMNQKKVRNNFQVLARYAPSLAANPTVAGAFVTTQVQRGLVDPSMIKTLAEAQAKIDKVREDHSSGGLGFSSATSLAQTAMSGA
jgi:hypothetical protein